MCSPTPLPFQLGCVFEINGQVTCQGVGRFSIPGTDCTSYMWCTLGSNGALNFVNASCPTTTKFSPKLQQCVNVPSGFACPDEACATVVDPNVFFQDPFDTTGTGYFRCLLDIGYAMYIPLYGTCSTNQVFLVQTPTFYNQGCCAINGACVN